MYGAFQSNAVQTNAAQVLVSSEATGGTPRYTYIPAYQRQEAQKREEIKRQKTEIQKVSSVIEEFRRRESTVSESIRLASKKRQQELLATQNELITEINRLLMVKAEMMARVKRNEEYLILMIALRRRRLRAF